MEEEHTGQKIIRLTLKPPKMRIEYNDGSLESRRNRFFGLINENLLISENNFQYLADSLEMDVHEFKCLCLLRGVEIIDWA